MATQRTAPEPSGCGGGSLSVARYGAMGSYLVGTVPDAGIGTSPVGAG